MAINPKQILDTVVNAGKSVVSVAGRPLRRRGSSPTPSGEPSTVGAAKPGKPRGPKSATAATKPPAKAKDKTSTPRKRATGRRTTASRAAASSGDEVADAASGKDD
jgi:hypothetical protein